MDQLSRHGQICKYTRFDPRSNRAANPNSQFPISRISKPISIPPPPSTAGIIKGRDRPPLLSIYRYLYNSSNERYSIPFKIQVDDIWSSKKNPPTTPPQKKKKFQKNNSFENSIRQRYCLNEDHIDHFQRGKKIK